MLTAAQMRAARALAGIDQRMLAELSGLSVPTIQRMEASDGVIRANVDSLMKLVSALESAGIELINPGAASATGGRGVRLREHVTNPKTTLKTTLKTNLKSKSKTVRQPKRVLERVR